MGHAIGRMATGKDGTKLSKKQYEAAMAIQSQTIAERNREHWANLENRQHQGEAIREKFKDPEFKKKFGERMKDVLRDPEIREERRAARLRDWEDPEYRRKIGEKRVNKKWYNNGINNIRLQPHEAVPEGYKEGRYQTPEQKAARAQKLRETAERKRKEKEQG
jgi:hypothetical protein